MPIFPNGAPRTSRRRAVSAGPSAPGAGGRRRPRASRAGRFTLWRTPLPAAPPARSIELRSAPKLNRGVRAMFERFTDRARRVVVLAQEEARMLNHNYIGTEH